MCRYIDMGMRVKTILYSYSLMHLYRYGCIPSLSCNLTDCLVYWLVELLFYWLHMYVDRHVNIGMNIYSALLIYIYIVTVPRVFSNKYEGPHASHHRRARPPNDRRCEREPGTRSGSRSGGREAHCTATHPPRGQRGGSIIRCCQESIKQQITEPTKNGRYKWEKGEEGSLPGANTTCRICEGPRAFSPRGDTAGAETFHLKVEPHQYFREARLPHFSNVRSMLFLGACRAGQRSKCRPASPHSSGRPVFTMSGRCPWRAVR
ncbi:hypothetical protein TCSYLVIO_009413 [Trypanosoma cruzi]|nr:hypothetical protein TCSYLVIO_009413 [Trypanosoma cruzi]